ncbi:flavodoxin family protein [Chloroflexota bacterium]
MYEVIYLSKGRNTRKLAEIIAAEIGVSAEDVKAKNKLAKDSFALLGSGCYFPMPGRGFKKFINSNDFNGRKIALFGTSGGGKGDEVKALEKMVTAKGAKVMGKFYCKGKFLFFSRKHPTSEDLQHAKNFAGELKG